MLLADLVEAADRAAATRSRKAKVAALSSVIARLPHDEVEAAVGFLIADVRQGPLGVGWATVGALARIESDHADTPTLTVTGVDHALSALVEVSGTGSVAERGRALRTLLARATEAEADFLRRLLVGELRQGALAGIVAEAIATAFAVPADAVRRAWMLTGDLRRTASLAGTGGAAALDGVGLVVGQAVAPMLAATSKSVADALAELGTCSVEWKLDGARIQVHRDGDVVRLYTRNLNDVTHRLPEVVEIALALPAGRFVLDAEVVGLAEQDAERPLPFQHTMSGFGREDSTSRASTMRPAFFDCIHLHGTDLLDVSLRDRIAALESFAPQWRVPGIITDDPELATAFLEESLAAGHEGVMVKAIESRYEAGRRGSSWRKVKPVRTFDLVVLGVEWGSGRRQGWLSNLHLGARDGANDSGGFVMVGKTFKGMTDELLRWQTEALLALETDRSGHVVHVRPELVVEIALDGVQRSTRYPGGVALRFARVKRYRTDKSPDEADTIAALQALLP